MLPLWSWWHGSRGGRPNEGVLVGTWVGPAVSASPNPCDQTCVRRLWLMDCDALGIARACRGTERTGVCDTPWMFTQPGARPGRVGGRCGRAQAARRHPSRQDVGKGPAIDRKDSWWGQVIRGACYLATGMVEKRSTRQSGRDSVGPAARNHQRSAGGDKKSALASCKSPTGDSPTGDSKPVRGGDPLAEK